MLASYVMIAVIAASHHEFRPITPKAESRVITVVATDFHFDLPSSLTAGPTTFQLVNHGRELHHVYLVRLSGERRAADLVNVLKAGGPPPSWATDVGGPNGVDPGATSPLVTVQLTPGHYAALCVIPSPDGKPHIMKGMFSDFVVRPGMQTVSSAPAPDLTISLVEYGFGPSRALSAGAHRILVRNDGRQSHELELARLLPGKKPADIPAWIEKMEGPPPAHFIGGVSALAAHQVNELSLTLTPGHYVMLCFLPDAKDGKPHIAHGMIRDFVIR
jgi:hypothetical protein